MEETKIGKWQPPIEVGSVVDGKKIVKMSKTFPYRDVVYRDNKVWLEGSAVIPVKFEDGTYAFVFCHKPYEPLCLISSNEKLRRAVMNSEEMPFIKDGIGSDVWHVFGRDKKGKFSGKMYYNEKHWRIDNFYRQAESVKVGHVLTGKKIIEMGESFISDFGSGDKINLSLNIVPIRFQDGTYAIVCISKNSGAYVIVPANKKLEMAITSAVEMPSVSFDLHDGYWSIVGKDKKGGFFGGIHRINEEWKVEFFYRTEKELKPPIRVGDVIFGKVITEIAENYFDFDGYPCQLVPVQFHDKTFGIVACDEKGKSLLRSRNDEANDVITDSTSMPMASFAGMGIETIKVTGEDEKGKYKIFIYFCFQADRYPDTIYRD